MFFVFFARKLLIYYQKYFKCKFRNQEKNIFSRFKILFVCNIFFVIAEPLTNLLSKRMMFKWTSDCQNAFNNLKAILKGEPVLLAQMLLKNLS